MCAGVSGPGPRAGRAGRGERESLTALVALPDALDQYLLEHPEPLLAGAAERAVLDPGSEPLSPGDFIGQWMALMGPAAAMAGPRGADSFPDFLRRLEQASVAKSLANLMTFPCVRILVERGRRHGVVLKKPAEQPAGAETGAAQRGDEQPGRRRFSVGTDDRDKPPVA